MIGGSAILLLLTLGQSCSAEYGGVQDSLVKRGYILHSLEGGNPRYTTLVRRNFLRFGKRSGAPPPPGEDLADSIIQASGKIDATKRTRNFIRFGKRSASRPPPPPIPIAHEPEEEDLAAPDASSSYDEDDYSEALMAAMMANQVKRDSRMRRVSNFLRFGKRAAPAAPVAAAGPAANGPAAATAAAGHSAPICEDYLPPGFCTQLQLAKYGTQKKIKPFLRFGR